MDGICGTANPSAKYLLFHRLEYYPLAKMLTPELLCQFLQAPELSTVGSSQERAAFVALYIEGRTVREAGAAIGVSKSQVTNLANVFQAKVTARIMELQSKGIGGSVEYKAAFRALSDRLVDLADESGSLDYYGDPNEHKLSREDMAECFGQPSPRYDDE